MSADDSITQFREFCDSHDCETCEYLRFKDRGERYACAIAWMETNAVSANDETELKPCPFCGGEAKLQQGLTWLIGCDTRGCIGYRPYSIDRDYETAEEAVAAWNRRAEA